MLGSEEQIKETYVKTGQAKLVFVPILDHADRSLQTHQAAECAGEQGQFWALHDLFYAEQNDLWRGDVRQVIKEKAARLPIDQEQFNTCIDEQRYVDLVMAQDQQRRELGIRTRPTISINGQLVVGPQPFPIYQQLIDPLLN